MIRDTHKSVLHNCVRKTINEIRCKYGLVEELIREQDRKNRGACVLIKNKDS